MALLSMRKTSGSHASRLVPRPRPHPPERALEGGYDTIAVHTHVGVTTQIQNKEQVAMSDSPSNLEFKLQHVVIAVQDVAEWFDLGLQLGLPSATLRLIAADPNIKDIKSQRLAMLSEWLKYDTAASWDKLAVALTTMGENVVAADVRSRFVKAVTTPVTDASDQDDKTCTSLCYTAYSASLTLTKVV